MKTDLYRCFDCAGALLYVGISYSAVVRLQNHRRKKEWASDISQITITKFDTREQAEKAEKKAIQEEDPIYNVARYFRRKSSSTRNKNWPPVLSEDQERRMRIIWLNDALTERTRVLRIADIPGVPLLTKNQVYYICVTKPKRKARGQK